MMTKHDAIRQLKDLRNQTRAQAHPRSRLTIQEYTDSGASDDVEALTMAIKALQAPSRRRMPIWACIMWCMAAAAIWAACVIYATT